jgi:3-hydroxyacyl-CoA dehydrogenase
MGAGIVQVAAQHGIKVAMADVSEKALENGESAFAANLPQVRNLTRRV